MFARLRRFARLVFLRWFGPFLPPGDPRPGVREPRVRRPGGRSSAAMLDEPREWSITDARADRDLVGGSRPR